MISQIESDRARPSYKILLAIAGRLEVELDQLLSDVDMHLDHLSRYKMARAMVADKQYEVAIPLLQEVLEAPHSMIPTADIQFELATCYFHTGQLQEAEGVFHEVKETAHFRQDHSMLALISMYAGLIMLQRRKHHIAIYHLQKALEEADKMEIADVFLTSEILFHLGDVAYKVGMLQEAIQYIDKAIELRQERGNLDEIGKVLLGLSQQYGRLKRTDKAIEYAELAKGLLEGVEHKVMQLRVEMATAALLGETGHGEEAVMMLEAVVGKFQGLGKREEEGMALVELAKVQVKRDDLDGAESNCRQARGAFPELHNGQIGIQRVLGQIALRRNNRAEAIQRLRQTAGLAKMLGEESEWQDAMHQIAAVYAEDNLMTDAYTLMEEIHLHTQHVLIERGIVL